VAAPGDLIDLEIEKPAAGGRMLARLDGQIAFVSGAIPGERVRARIEFVRGGVLFARAEVIESASPDRRADGVDRSCGGNDYAYIAYDRQLSLKRDLVTDAFSRIARLSLPAGVHLHGSPEEGYRMRARLHVDGARVGFYRQASHDICDAMSTGQLHAGAGPTLAAISRVLGEGKVRTARSLDLSENVTASARAVQIELDPDEREHGRWDAVLAADGATGVAVSRRGRVLASRGLLTVADELDLPQGGPLRLTRQVGAFFQGNRFLLQSLVDRVLAAIPEGPLVDLYSGCGLFGLAHAAAGRGRVDLVENDRLSFADLTGNAAPFGDVATPHEREVEHYLAARPALDGRTVLVDPPRTGLSRESSGALADSKASRVVYLSCDVATLARDARRLVDASFALDAVEIFDLFPMTAHVETLAVFHR
jgi:tRNA/tmRNA/rRNA uracil-C5-methylase (TrmA/RlmC/RlmD family)